MQYIVVAALVAMTPLAIQVQRAAAFGESILNYGPYAACWYGYLYAGYNALTAADICAYKYHVPAP
jgi:hypothetical protein